MADLKKRATHLNNRYSLSLAQYDEMYARQNGNCAICHCKPSPGGRKNVNSELFVDHDHETGDIRGLLCYHCNTVIGMAKDNPYVLENAATYLRREPAYRRTDLVKPRPRGWQQRAKTHCRNGHPYDEKNTYVPLADTYRQCRICRAKQKKQKSINKKARLEAEAKSNASL